MKTLKRKCSALWLLIAFPALSFSQYSVSSTILKHNSDSRSALISNIFSTGAINQTSLMGVASWQDNNKIFEARSIIQFDLKQVPDKIQQNPDLILSAELILYPKEVNEKIDNPFTLLIQRVLEPWKDSSLTWTNQPAVQWYYELKIDSINYKRRISKDVTKLVRDLFKYGNYGFMFSCKNSQEGDVSEWFASEKNADVKKHPELIISYANGYTETLSADRGRLSQMDQRNTYVPLPNNSSRTSQPVIKK